MPSETVVTACILVIGNEILSGRTRDANVQYIATRLNELGVRVREVRVIPDVKDTIVDTLNAVRDRFDYVLTTGGIGPTHDDITTECVAAAFGVETYLDHDTVEAMRAARPERPMNEARMRMATFPAGAELILNDISVAPGYRLGNVFVMAGVPSVMRTMFENAAHHFKGGAVVQSRSLRLQLAEGELAAPLGELQERYETVDIGSYPAMRDGRFGVSVVLRGTDKALLDAAFDDLLQIGTRLDGNPVEEVGGDPLEPGAG